MSVGTYSAKDVADFVYKDGESQAIQIANKSEEIINIDHALSTNVLTGEYEVFVPDGKVTIGHWEGNPTTPAVSETAIQTTSNVGTSINPYNSNSTEIVRGSVKQAYNTSVENGQVKISSTPKSGSFGTNASYILGEVNAASAAVGIGTSLGKVIGNELYNANPDIWSGIDISQMDSTWWDRIIADNPFNSFLMNAIFGIDVNGNAQAYVNEDAYAYLAQYMAQQSFFAPSSFGVFEKPSDFTLNARAVPIVGSPPLTNPTITIYFYTRSSGNRSVTYRLTSNNPIYYEISTNMDGWICVGYASKSPITFDPKPDLFRRTYTYNGNSYYGYGGTFYAGGHAKPLPTNPYGYNVATVQQGTSDGQLDCDSAILLAIAGAQQQAVDGVTNQDGATLPNVDTWDTPQDTLDSLKQQYPDLWNDALTYDVPDADGNLQPQTWVPIPWPEIAPNVNPWLNTQPTTNTDLGTQTQTQVNLRTMPDTLTQPLTTTLTQPITDTPTPDVPQNPVDTGNGSSPTPIVPTGSASALWSVYHPTQQQVNDFGGWLWSSNFIDQLLRMFQNPMDAVVSLRKVFVMPVDAGVSTIHAGYLDSEVPSSYITQQYVFKDCGTINCYEQFGNVFDYVNTEISMYLPFIGIVPLNTSEVMRSQLHVVYGVDMFTGACLASIEVIRDGNTVTMYQYAGNASVEYPLSGQRASSFLGGLMSLGGAVASVATGGGSVVAAGAAISGMSQMSTVNVSHSGSFSGNAGAMGIKKPYLIIERPQTKVASNDEHFTGYSNNYSGKVSDFSGMVKARKVHVLGINATDGELAQIETLLKDGIII